MSPAEPRPGLRDLDPYAAPQLQVSVRLNTNECPHAPPEGFRLHLAEAIRDVTLNRYPDREAAELRAALAAHAGHPIGGTWAANGSNEIIQQLLLAYGGPGRRVVLFDPTYLLYERVAWIAHSELVRLRLDAPWVIDSEDVERALDADPAVVFVCSPNNPTGNAQAIESIEQLAGGDALVIVDEAYVEFGGKTAAGLIALHPNLVVVRTFSKAFALAGARIGYCLTTPEVADDLRRVRVPYHLSALAQAAGVAALRHANEALALLDEVRRQRDRIIAALAARTGLEVFPSDANFVLFRPPRPAAEVWRGLLERGVLVRDVSAAVPGCLRVTAGTTTEVDAFLGALEEVLR